MAREPRTIQELANRCKRLKVSTEGLKIFVGEDSAVPGGFGICRTGAEFLVYRNRRDGGRTERYRGTDEKAAVGIMLQKLKDLACAEIVRCGDTGDEPLYWARNLAGSEADNFKVSNPAQPDYAEAREGAKVLLNMTLGMGRRI